jgi:hypothetical protein
MKLQSLQLQLKKVEQRQRLLQHRLERRAAKEFTSLPAKVGLKSVDALILCLAPYASPRLRNRVGANESPMRVSSGRATPSGRSKGTRYSAAIKAEVKAAMSKGDQTAAELSKRFGPSVFSINLWKKQWGFVKARPKRQ